MLFGMFMSHMFIPLYLPIAQCVIINFIASIN